jgi:CBS domain-containing protein
VLALARRLVGQGVGATALARLVSHLNDALARRVIHITERDLESTLGPLPRWTWLALGSEGREEQTVATDQDNAIIFQGDGPSLRPAFQRLAAAINQGLAEIGFPLCKGGVMAMNEKWCRSADEWRSTLGSWFSLPNPQALLDANIFLDFRGLYGALDLAQDLRAWVSAQVAGHRLFLRSLAQDAMRDEVGRLSRNLLAVSLARSLRRKGFKMDWLSPSCFDMKRDGTAPVVYFSRVLSLAYGLSETATDGRFSGLVAASAMSQSEAQQMREAFNVLQKYRLRAQLRYVLLDPSASQKMGSPNRLVLDELSTHEIEQLSEALAHLGRLKARLEMDFLR